MSNRSVLLGFGVAFVALAFAVSAPAQVTQRVSQASDDSQTNDQSVVCRLSGNARYIVFSSEASNLVAGDTNSTYDAFVRDRDADEDGVFGEPGAMNTVRVSVSTSGAQGNGSVGRCDISSDGRFVVFASFASNLVAGDTNGHRDIFVRDRDTDTNGVFDEPNGVSTVRINVSATGAEANGTSYYPSLSANGRWVCYQGDASNLVASDTNGKWDIFVHDRTTGGTELASVTTSGGQADDNSFAGWISRDGQSVTFQSYANNLVASDSNPSSDIFVRNRTSGVTELASVDSNGNQPIGHHEYPHLSADGRFVAFVSFSQDFDPSDRAPWDDVFVHDRVTGATVRASLNSSGSGGDADSGSPRLSASGRYVTFNSWATNLVADDTNQVVDVFLRDLQLGVTERVSVDSRHSEGNDHSGGAVFSDTERHIAFASRATDLIDHDTNGFSDAFVHDLLTLTFNGIPLQGNLVNYSLTRAMGETGNLVVVLLSCSGTASWHVPDGRIAPFTPDACTLLGLKYLDALIAIIGSGGTANTPPLAFPPLPPGIRVDALGLTFQVPSGRLVSISNPTSFVSQ